MLIFSEAFIMTLQKRLIILPLKKKKKTCKNNVTIQDLKHKIYFFQLPKVEGKTTTIFAILAHRALVVDQLRKSFILPFALLIAVLYILKTM